MLYERHRGVTRGAVELMHGDLPPIFPPRSNQKKGSEMNIQSAERPVAEQAVATNLSAPAPHRPTLEEGFSPNDLGLSESEVNAVVDANWSHWFETPELDRHVDWNVEDSLQDGLAEKWNIDGPALVEKLRALTTKQQDALVAEIKRRRAAVV